MARKIDHAEFTDLLQRLHNGEELERWQQKVVAAAVKAALAKEPDAVNTREFVIDAVKAAYNFVDPNGPRTIFVEYIGRCMNRSPPKGVSNALGVPLGGFETDAYASGWVDD